MDEGKWITLKDGRRIFLKPKKIETNTTNDYMNAKLRSMAGVKVENNEEKAQEHTEATDEEINKMQQQSDEIYNNYDRDKISDLNKYTSGYGYYKDITRALERNKGNADKIFEGDKKIVKSIDDLTEKMALEKDTILYRGAKAEHFYKYIV